MKQRAQRRRLANFRSRMTLPPFPFRRTAIERRLSYQVEVALGSTNSIVSCSKSHKGSLWRDRACLSVPSTDDLFGDIKNIKQATGLTLPALSYGVILPFDRTIREFYAHRKAIPCFWQTISHSSDLQKFSR